MAKTVIPEGGRRDSASAHLLWTFMTAISGISDELERARLMATGLPSLLPCRLSGVALVDESETTLRSANRTPRAPTRYGRS